MSNSTNNTISTELIPSTIQLGGYELFKVDFLGNEAFTSIELQEYVNSKATTLSFPHKVLLTYYNQCNRNKTFPAIITNELERSLKTFEKEYKFFNEDVANSDVDALIDLYNVNGYHFVDIYYSFLPDTAINKNVLTFYITEGNQYKIDTINYIGLDKLPNNIRARLDTARRIKSGDKFSEMRIETEMQTINQILLNAGYMYSKYSYPNVVMDTTRHTDSVVGYFDVGEKIQFGKIIFVDSTRNQKRVAESTRRKLLLFKEGDVYARWRIERSYDNLQSIGVFESIAIDTLKREYAPQDTVRDFVITSLYQKQIEWDGGTFLNQTEIDNLINFGVEGGISHRNLFGSAQHAGFFAKISLKDLNYFFDHLDFPDYEFKTGVKYSQPLLWQIGNSKVSSATSLTLSYETQNQLFQVFTLAMPFKFNISLPRRTYFTGMQIELNFDREVPINYAEVNSTAFANATTMQDSVDVYNSLKIYGNIYNYLNEPETHIFTSNILSLSLISNKKSNVLSPAKAQFSPTSGNYSHISIDGFNVFLSLPAIAGTAKYFRAQIMHTNYWSLSRFLVVAVKGKIGTTYLSNEKNAFVPFDRQFFAGGSNSIRGWKARDLRYSTADISFANTSLEDYATNYIGSRTLIEGSFELRRNLSDFPGVNESLASILNDVGIALYYDIGNAFGWYYEDDISRTPLKFSDYFTKLAMSVGIGIYYDTPVGPIRFDFAAPVYDPSGTKKPFASPVFHFGIGHAF